MADDNNSRGGDAGNGARRDGLLTTGDMARLSNNTLRTVRFYEEANILHPTQRTDGGHRLFAHSELRKLELVSELRAAGLSLEEIRDLLEVKQRATSGSAASRDALDRLGGQITRLSERIEILTRLRDDLQASQSVLQECQRCTGNNLYPDGCRNCSVMTDQPSLPKAVNVVWSIDRN
ncbi:MAG: MerR family transcriptional regulator [Polyangiaceae bacterium]